MDPVLGVRDNKENARLRNVVIVQPETTALSNTMRCMSLQPILPANKHFAGGTSSIRSILYLPCP